MLAWYWWVLIGLVSLASFMLFSLWYITRKTADVFVRGVVRSWLAGNFGKKNGGGK